MWPIRGMIWRPVVFVIACMAWMFVSCRASAPIRSGYAFIWHDDLSESPSVPLALDCLRESSDLSVQVVAHVTNQSGMPMNFRTVFDLAVRNASGRVHGLRICDQTISLEAGETRVVSCAVTLADGDVAQQIRVAAWNSKVYPKCDRGCGSARGTCEFTPDIRTLLSRPDIQLATGVVIGLGLALVGLGAVWWRLVGLWGHTMMVVSFVLASLLAGLVVRTMLADQLGWVLVIAPLAAAIAAAALWPWLRRSPAGP